MDKYLTLHPPLKIALKSVCMKSGRYHPKLGCFSFTSEWMLRSLQPTICNNRENTLSSSDILFVPFFNWGWYYYRTLISTRLLVWLEQGTLELEFCSLKVVSLLMLCCRGVCWELRVEIVLKVMNLSSVKSRRTEISNLWSVRFCY